MGPDEVENRWISEAKVGPDIAIFSMGRSSIGQRERAETVRQTDRQTQGQWGGDEMGS